MALHWLKPVELGPSYESVGTKQDSTTKFAYLRNPTNSEQA